MMTLEEALKELNRKPDRPSLERYIARSWLRPVHWEKHWVFEEIDLVRARLIHHLEAEMRLEEEAMDMVLHLLDQVYGLREQMRRIRYALARQPESLREDILALLMPRDYTDV